MEEKFIFVQFVFWRMSNLRCISKTETLFPAKLTTAHIGVARRRPAYSSGNRIASRAPPARYFSADSAQSAREWLSLTSPRVYGFQHDHNRPLNRSSHCSPARSVPSTRTPPTNCGALCRPCFYCSERLHYRLQTLTACDARNVGLTRLICVDLHAVLILLANSASHRIPTSTAHSVARNAGLTNSLASNSTPSWSFCRTLPYAA